MLIACNLMWAMQFTCIKLVQDQVGPLFTIWAPMLLATIMLIPFFLTEKREIKREWSDLLVLFRPVIFGSFPAQLLMTIGTQQSTATNAGLITLILPISTVGFAVLLLEEKLTWSASLSIVIAVAGVICCSFQNISNFAFEDGYIVGNALILLSVIANAYYNVSCKNLFLKFSDVEVVFFTYLIILIVLGPFVLYSESATFYKIPDFTLKTWTGLMLLAFFHNFLSMVLFFKALKNLSAIQTGMSNYMITLFGMPIAVIWLGEKLDFITVLGGTLILFATFLLALSTRKPLS